MKWLAYIGWGVVFATIVSATGIESWSFDYWALLLGGTIMVGTLVYLAERKA